MEVVYDRLACGGWFQCVQEWDAFEMNVVEGKADLAGSEEREDGIFVREVPEELEEEVLAACESCPVDAIQLTKDGEQLYP